MSKKIKKKVLAQKQKSAAKHKLIELRHKRKKQILQVMVEHNKIKYRNLPGLKGKFPYQLTPWTFGQTEEFMKTGINPTLRGGDLKMVIVTLNDNQVTGVTDKDTGAALDFEVAVANSLSTPVEPAAPVDTATTDQPASDAGTTPDATPSDTGLSGEQGQNADGTPVDQGTENSVASDQPATTTDTTDAPVTGHAEVPLSDGSSVEVEVTENPAS